MSTEDEYEEEIVCVDLCGLIDCNWSSFVGKNCKFIGLDSDEVVIQLGKHIFQGSYKECAGTRLLINDDGKGGEDDVLKTYKILEMQKIFVHEKSNDGPVGTSGCMSEAIPEPHVQIKPMDQGL